MNKIFNLFVICISLISCNYSNTQKSKNTTKDKRWYVQFAIDTRNQDSIISALKDFNCELVENLVKTEITSSEVHCFEGKMLLYKDTVILKKQEYKDWKTPIYYFDYNESFTASKNNSNIKKLDKSLKSYGLRVKLIDYGFMEKLE